MLQCPRANRRYNYCRDAYISDALVGTFQSNYYQMEKGDTCMIKIENALSEDEAAGFWKVWKDQRDLGFYLVDKRDESNDNKLSKLDEPNRV